MELESIKDGKGALEEARNLIASQGTVPFMMDRLVAGLKMASNDPCRTFRAIPGSAQVEFQKSDARVRLVLGSNRSGKTKTGSMEMMQRLTNTHPYWKPNVYKPLRALVVAMDYPSFTQQGLGKKIWSSVPKRRVSAVSWMDRKTEAPSYIRLDTGSELFLASAEKGSVKFEGADWDLVWMDEIIPDDVILAIRRGLSDRNGMVWNTVTPLIRTKFFEECIKGERFDPAYYKVFHFRAEDTMNTGYVSRSAWEAYIRAVPSHQRETRRSGALPPLGGGNVFANVPTCRRPDEKLFVEMPNNTSWIGQPLAFGLDLAKHRDYIVLTCLDTSGTVRLFRRFHGVKWTSAIAHIFELLTTHYTGAPLVICLDSSGIGDVVYDLLSDLCGNFKDGTAIVPIAIPTGVATLKANLIDDLSLALESHMIGWPGVEKPDGMDEQGRPQTLVECHPDLQRLEDELEAFSAEETAGGHMSYHAPDKGGRSKGIGKIKNRLKLIGGNPDDLEATEADDCVISIALARRALRVLESGSTFDARSTVQFISLPQMDAMDVNQ